MEINYCKPFERHIKPMSHVQKTSKIPNYINGNLRTNKFLIQDSKTRIVKNSLPLKRNFLEDGEGVYSIVVRNNRGFVETACCISIDAPKLDKSPTTRTKFLKSRLNQNIRLATPKFHSQIQNRICNEGEDVRFRCVISNATTTKWYKNGIVLTSNSKLIIGIKNDVRFFEIRKVTFQDAGIYKIVLENEHGKIESTASLDVKKSLKPQIISTSPPPKFLQSFSRRLMALKTKIGGRIFLTTQLKTSLKSNEKWLIFNGKNITENRRVLIREIENKIFIEIIDVTKSDQGHYTLILKYPNEVISSSCRVQIYDDKDEISKIFQHPKITKGLQSVNCIEGFSVDLSFEFGCEIPFTFTWSKNGQKLSDSTEDFEFIDHGSMLTLRIHDPFLFDSGTYCCEIETPVGTCRTECHLQVEEIDTNLLKCLIPKFKKTPVHSVVQAGETAIFSTKIESPKSNDVSWFVAGRQMRSNGENVEVEQSDDGTSTIILRNIEHNLSGEVKCAVYNRQNRKVFNLFYANLTVLPQLSDYSECNYSYFGLFSGVNSVIEDQSVYITKKPDDIKTTVGETIRIEVEYEGFPEPKVCWMRAERIIDTNESNVTITTQHGKSVLNVTNINSQQSGKYTVEVMNDFSQDLSSLSVAVESKPEPPMSLTISKGTDRVAVAWSGPKYDGGCMITGFRLEMQENNGEWVEVAAVPDSLAYTVKNLKPKIEYRFRVRAQNIHGLSEPSDPTNLVILENEIIEKEQEKVTLPIKSKENFNSRFEIHEELGKGRFGVVTRVVEKDSGNNFAVKIIKCIKAIDRKKVHEEIEIMSSLKHPKLLQLFDTFETPKEVIMLMEFINGGELFERVVADDFTLTERDCVLFMRQICEGVAYMHNQGVVHLDLKPENILCCDKINHHIKIIDFGLAQRLDKNKPLRVLFGTPEFVPPEIVNYEPVGIESDMWSVGVICYVLLSGLSPFMGDSDMETFTNVTTASFDFDDEAFESVSEEAKNFIGALLVRKKEDRPSARECLESKWLTDSNENFSNTRICTTKLKKFIIRRKWQKTGHAIRAIGRLTTFSASRKNT